MMHHLPSLEQDVPSRSTVVDSQNVSRVPSPTPPPPPTDPHPDALMRGLKEVLGAPVPEPDPHYPTQPIFQPRASYFSARPMSVKEIEALVQKGRANGELSNETPIPQPEHTNTDTTLALPTLEAIVENQCMTGMVREADLTEFTKYRFILTITPFKLITPGADPANAGPCLRDDLHLLLGNRFNRDIDMGIIGVRYMRAHNRYLVIVPSILEAASKLIFKNHEYTKVTDEHGNTYSLTFEDYPEDEETPNIEPILKGKKEIGKEGGRWEKAARRGPGDGHSGP